MPIQQKLTPTVLLFSIFGRLGMDRQTYLVMISGNTWKWIRVKGFHRDEVLEKLKSYNLFY